ncbi:hypothetical protein DPEC_G00148520 [Dallia pectoralis]|uniref:Uncharacterized protein n=1 Tax=Dallia pectoralis TaxID=75939 RepID=A0ACC2GIS2_DALPE|nr:hypothetical protein DPEC_G00148520 [Dallia pectoralis]
MLSVSKKSVSPPPGTLGFRMRSLRTGTGREDGRKVWRTGNDSTEPRWTESVLNTHPGFTGPAVFHLI